MKITRRTFLKCGGAGIAAGLTGLGYGTLVGPDWFSIERVTVPIPRLPRGLEGFKIAVLSDFHLHPFTQLPHIEEAVRIANRFNPDLAVLLGDYVDAAASVEAIDDLGPALARLNARLGIFGVLGNHDHRQGATIVQEALTRAGLSVLRNSGLPLASHGDEFFLAGLDSVSAGRRDNIPAALSRQRGGAPTLLLAHEPDIADRVIASGRNVSLQLSGHSHGGQVRLPYAGALFLPTWGRKYDQGLYNVGGMPLYTSRGIGVTSLPIRFNCPPEVAEITLRAG